MVKARRSARRSIEAHVDRPRTIVARQKKQENNDNNQDKTKHHCNNNYKNNRVWKTVFRTLLEVFYVRACAIIWRRERTIR